MTARRRAGAPRRGALSRRTGEILAFIRSTQRRCGAPPTVREIGEHCGIRSTNGVHYHLSLLERERWILRRPGRARGIALLEGGARPRFDLPAAGGAPRISRPAGIPILGRIAAGGPLFAAEQVEGRLGAESLARLGPDFALRIQGTSMSGAGILPGDLVLVRQDPEPRDGEIVVALIGDEATVKRLAREPGRVLLKPENPDFEPIVVDASSPPLRFLGRVVGVYRELG